jgi:peptide-methionine (S)-S-oxide reductase
MKHFIYDSDLHFPNDESETVAMFGMGCFWGAERKFWSVSGVELTAVGYAGGKSGNPSYQEVCTGITGHNEVVKIKFNPNIVSYENLLKVFLENHNPTQGNRQGNDIGTQYRSSAYFFNEDQKDSIEKSLKRFSAMLLSSGFPSITTEVLTAPNFYLAEEYHQQYLAKNPNGYCGLGGTGLVLADTVLSS